MAKLKLKVRDVVASTGMVTLTTERPERPTEKKTAKAIDRFKSMDAQKEHSKAMLQHSFTTVRFFADDPSQYKPGDTVEVTIKKT